MSTYCCGSTLLLELGPVCPLWEEAFGKGAQLLELPSLGLCCLSLYVSEPPALPQALHATQTPRSKLSPTDPGSVASGVPRPAHSRSLCKLPQLKGSHSGSFSFREATVGHVLLGSQVPCNPQSPLKPR